MRFPLTSAMLAVLFAAGCGGKKEPLMSHGKPVAHWIEELKSPDARARKKAVVALGHAGKADPDAVPALIRALEDQDPTVRDQAVLALLQLGPDAKEALPALQKAKNDADPTVRDHAATAVQRIEGK